MITYVHFLTESEKDAEEFIREYVLDAIDRTEDIEGCEGIGLAVNEPPNPDGGSAGMSIWGDFNQVIEQERKHWKSYQERGVISGWESHSVEQEQLATKIGEQGVSLGSRLSPLVGRIAKLVYEEFGPEEPFPEPVDTYPEDTGLYPVGWGYVLHNVTFAGLGYTAEDELDMYLFTIEESLRIFAERNDEDAVDDKIDELVESIEAMRPEIKEGRPQP